MGRRTGWTAALGAVVGMLVLVIGAAHAAGTQKFWAANIVPSPSSGCGYAAYPDTSGHSFMSCAFDSASEECGTLLYEWPGSNPSTVTITPAIFAEGLGTDKGVTLGFDIDCAGNGVQLEDLSYGGTEVEVDCADLAGGNAGKRVVCSESAAITAANSASRATCQIKVCRKVGNSNDDMLQDAYPSDFLVTH